MRRELIRLVRKYSFLERERIHATKALPSLMYRAQDTRYDTTPSQHNRHWARQSHGFFYLFGVERQARPQLLLFFLSSVSPTSRLVRSGLRQHRPPKLLSMKIICWIHQMSCNAFANPNIHYFRPTFEYVNNGLTKMPTASIKRSVRNTTS